MKRLRLFSLLLALTLLVALLTGCGSASTGADNGAMDTTAAGEAQMAEDAAAGSYGFATEESQNAAETPQSDDNTVTRPSDAKLIYTGSLTLECTDLTAAMAGLEQLIGDYGGYLERQEVYHQTSWQTADYTVRVPSEQYHAFLGAVGTWEGGKLTYQSTTVDDVGGRYTPTLRTVWRPFRSSWTGCRLCWPRRRTWRISSPLRVPSLMWSMKSRT